MYEILIEKAFAAAHALRLPDGQLEPVHGHNWTVVVSVASDELDAIETVMDFHELERIVEGVIGPFRDRHLNEVEPFVSKVNPTAERVAWWIGTQTDAKLAEGCKVRYVSVGEAPECTARWWSS